MERPATKKIVTKSGENINLINVCDKCNEKYFDGLGGNILDKRGILEYRLLKLRARTEMNSITGKTALTFGIILLLIISPIIYSQYKFNIYFFMILSYGILFMLSPLTLSSRLLETEIQDILNELDLLAIADTSIEQRAEKLFKLHQFELKKYYDQTLAHSAWIFNMGLICILLGFAIIGVSLYIVSSKNLAPEFIDKIILATLGAIGGMLSNFIAAIYLKMYSETIKSLTDFHNRLVMTHHLHFANFLISKISDKELREKMLAELALNSAKQ